MVPAHKIWRVRQDPDEVAAVCASALRQAEADEWQPIETAPRDGTPILACWNDATDALLGAIYWEEASDYREEEGWIENDQPVKAPTHWRPLPDKPKTLDTNTENKP